jgi:hypothetical protein
VKIKMRVARLPTLLQRRQYRDMQIVCRQMLLEACPDLEERNDYEDIVCRMVERIMTEMYEKYTPREISNAITIVKIALDDI